jgi:hypothetical protein
VGDTWVHVWRVLPSEQTLDLTPDHGQEVIEMMTDAMDDGRKDAADAGLHG